MPIIRHSKRATLKKKRGGLMPSGNTEQKLAEALNEIHTLNQLIASKDRTIDKLNKTIIILEDTLKTKNC